jgi:hypothetical protein
MILSSGGFLHFFIHRSKVILIRDRAVSHSSKGSLMFLSHAERKIKGRPIERWSGTGREGNPEGLKDASPADKHRERPKI